ncbi:hypothetical protein ACQKCH_15040 [Nubsella zeaxanthinifaciens]|uniref:hypothetical protein n=1 Tax=Nubsella zeaxanthinifaciens TaxID=392412 RepID=UPI003D06C92B
MTELEKFVKALRENLQSSKMHASIGDMTKFVYLKKDYIVVNIEQLNLNYCEKFIEPNPEKYYTSFIRFCGRAMAYAYKKSQFGFIFSYNNAQAIKHINLNEYRRDLIHILAKKFDDYEFNIDANNEISMHIKSYTEHWNKLGLESRVEQAVYNYNRYNPSYLVHAATYIRLEDYHYRKNYTFSINF